MEILVRGHAKKKTLKLISEIIDQVYGLDFKEVYFFIFLIAYFHLYILLITL